LKLYAIYTPYVTNHIYQEFFKQYEKEPFLHCLIWNAKNINKDSLEFGEYIKAVIGEVRKNKTEKQMSMRDEIPELIITCPKKMKEYYKKTESDIKACTCAREVIIRG